MNYAGPSGTVIALFRRFELESRRRMLVLRYDITLPVRFVHTCDIGFEKLVQKKRHSRTTSRLKDSQNHRGQTSGEGFISGPEGSFVTPRPRLFLQGSRYNPPWTNTELLLFTELAFWRKLLYLLYSIDTGIQQLSYIFISNNNVVSFNLLIFCAGCSIFSNATNIYVTS